MVDRTLQELEERIALLAEALGEYTGLYGFTPHAAALQCSRRQPLLTPSASMKRRLSVVPSGPDQAASDSALSIEAQVRSRLRQLEDALLEYVARYGLTDAARQAMMPWPPGRSEEALTPDGPLTPGP